jgi:hypothetical protein
MARVGFETITPVFERAKTVHALPRGHCDRWGRPEYWEKTFPNAILSTNLTLPDVGLNPCRRGWKPTAAGQIFVLAYWLQYGFYNATPRCLQDGQPPP